MSTSVIELQEPGPGIVQITMQDRAHKNGFSPQLSTELIAAFKSINSSERYRAVVLTGYDSYFSSGGTRDSLTRFSAGQGRFSDTNLYSLALDCPIPVIAAMQGHAIGGGFVLGLFADMIVLSREGVYTTNFMQYGFTPGMGATCVVPKKLGIALAEEMLLVARTYRGAELERRGIPFPVLPRSEVLAYALDLARDLADKPRHALITLKDQLVADLRAQLPAVVDQEEAMHSATFHSEEVRDRIQTRFGQ